MYRWLSCFPQNCMGIYTALFVFIWLTAWTLNALQNTQFDLDKLRDIFAWLMTQLNATYAIDSIWNSPKGHARTAAGEPAISVTQVKSVHQDGK